MFRSLPQLEAYYWVARLGSFRGAADHLGLTQPSISIRLKELETEAGGALFVRGARGIRMTDKGRAMFDHVERIIALLSDLDGHIREAGPLRGVLRVGVPDSFALCCLPRFMSCLEQEHPDLKLAITVDNSRVLTQRLEEGVLDLAVVAQPALAAGFRSELLGTQLLSWVASPSFISIEQPLRPDDLKQFPILTNPFPSPTFSILMQWFESQGLIPSKISTCSSIAAIEKLAVAGSGVCVLPTCVVQERLAAGNLVELTVSPLLPRQEIFLAYAKAATARAAPHMRELLLRAIAGTGFVQEDVSDD